MIVVSTGCPAGIGPEVAVRAASKRRSYPCLLVGDPGSLERAAELCGVPRKRLVEYQPGQRLNQRDLYWMSAGPRLSARDCDPRRPSRAAGRAQLASIELAYTEARRLGAALVTGPVSKAVIARSGAPGAGHFLGHTEWLQALDGAKAVTMCFASRSLVTALVTTHLPLTGVPKTVTPDRVRTSCLHLAELLRRLGTSAPSTIAICALNPHAGESGLLGDEEQQAIVPGMRLAQRCLRKSAQLIGPIGAETAYRKARAGEFEGVLAMYHDQATIPMKLVAFGEAVNITMGLSVVRTSVDHGTAYDIAWQGRADALGMHSAMRTAARLLASA